MKKKLTKKLIWRNIGFSARFSEFVDGGAFAEVLVELRRWLVGKVIDKMSRFLFGVRRVMNVAVVLGLLIGLSIDGRTAGAGAGLRGGLVSEGGGYLFGLIKFAKIRAYTTVEEHAGTLTVQHFYKNQHMGSGVQHNPVLAADERRTYIYIVYVRTHPQEPELFVFDHDSARHRYVERYTTRMASNFFIGKTGWVEEGGRSGWYLSTGFSAFQDSHHKAVNHVYAPSGHQWSVDKLQKAASGMVYSGGCLYNLNHLEFRVKGGSAYLYVRKEDTKRKKTVIFPAVNRSDKELIPLLEWNSYASDYVDIGWSEVEWGIRYNEDAIVYGPENAYQFEVVQAPTQETGDDERPLLW